MITSLLHLSYFYVYYYYTIITSLLPIITFAIITYYYKFVITYYYNIITSLLVIYYVMITNGKSCNNDSIITCYAKVSLHYYVIKTHYYIIITSLLHRAGSVVQCHSIHLSMYLKPSKLRDRSARRKPCYLWFSPQHTNKQCHALLERSAIQIWD